ncbi:MAG: MFS transporter [Rickettsiaceae bacterium]|nr:MAG: MFS transporter [Rickettsiaceae bacterium]
MNKRKLILASGIANTFEWYDYVLFGHFAQIIGQKFFPDSDPGASLLKTFIVFAVGYLMRPIGGIIFGIIGDKFGRRYALSASVICMSFPTALIGIIPTYDDIGLSATVIMILIRMLQGISMGGALTGSVSFIIEHTNEKKRGITGSIPMASICIGILLGSAVSHCIRVILSPAQFSDWGWRLPFLIGIFIFFAGVYIKKSTEETPLFEDLISQGHTIKSPLKEVFRTYWFDMLISIFINSTGSVIFYLQTIYLMNFLEINRGFDQSSINYLMNFSYFLMIIVTIFAGWISDFVGRKQIFVVINIIIILSFILGLMNIFESSNFNHVIIGQIILAILAASYIGPEPALQASLYPTNIRNTALSISYNTATSVFGGTTPYVLAYLVQKTGSISSCKYYVISCACLSLIALKFYKNRSIE